MTPHKITSVALVALWLIGMAWVGGPDLDRPVGATAVTWEQPTATTRPVTIVTPATVTTPATRGTQVQTTPTAPPTPPSPSPGDCESWGEWFTHYGATDTERSFFVPRILDRETGCGRDTLNERTGDSGICQHNPIHNRAGYFGGRYFGDGGWLMALHGLRTRQNTDSVTWVPACLTLYRVCGSRPWSPPYGCANRSL